MHYNRLQLDLGGIWEMATGVDRPAEGWHPVAVPGTVNTIFPDLTYYEGVLWYRRSLELPVRPTPDHVWRWIFKGANYLTEVWADGHRLGEHRGGYTEFALDWPEAGEGRHTVEVRVDAALGRTRLPHLDSDWFNYGGLYRPVRVELVPPLRIDAVQVATPRRNGDFGLEVNITLGSRFGGEAGPMELDLELTGEGLTEPVRVSRACSAPGQVAISVPSERLRTIRPWELGDAHLYTLQLRLVRDGHVWDAAHELVGFREIALSGHEILVNGHPVRLLGVGKHDEHVQLGRTIPLAQYQKELELMRRANINAFRTSHYAPAEEVVDLADQLGIGVILEGAPFFHTGYPKPHLYAQFSDSDAVTDGTRQLTEAVRTFSNHPSVLMWSIGNEMGTGREGAEEFVAGRVAAVRAMDPSRPIGFSGIAIKPGQHAISERAADLVDYIDAHFYAGWYDVDEYGTVEDSLALLDELHRRWPDKPILIGEFGADALPGYRSFEHARWSEDYQAALISRLVAEYARRPFVAGMFIWHLYDFRTPPRRALRRAHEFNHKGILDENRRPKLAYDAVRRVYGQIARGEGLPVE